MARYSLAAGGVPRHYPRHYWWYILAMLALALALGVELSAGNAFAGAPLPNNSTRYSPLATLDSPPLTCTLDYIVTASTGGSIDPGTTDIGNHTDEGTTAIGLPFPFVFYGSAFTSANVSSNGNLQFTSNNETYVNVCLPTGPTGTSAMNNLIAPYWDDQCTGPCAEGATLCTGCGIFTSTVGPAGSRIFNIEWRTNLYGQNTLLDYELRLYEAAGANGGSRFDFVYGSVQSNGVSATVGSQKGTGPQNTQYSCNTATLSSGLLLHFEQNCTGPTPTPTITLTPTPCVDYTIATSTDVTTTASSLIPGSQGDDQTALVTFPFPITFYGNSFASGHVSTNGNLQFTSNTGALTNLCLPAATLNNTIMGYWDDLLTNQRLTSDGIYTNVTGVAPNRVYTIRWVGCLFVDFNLCGGDVDFNMVFRENSPTISVIYGNTGGNNGSLATSGVQYQTGARYTQFSCNTASLTPGLRLDYVPGPCGPTPTPTRTPTITATPTPNACGPGSLYFEAEPNNTITNAMRLGSVGNAQILGGINPVGDVDYYRFNANAGDRVWAYLYTQGASSSTDSQLYLLNSLSQTVQFDDDGGSQAAVSSGIAGVTLTQTGGYYLLTKQFGNGQTMNPYNLYLDVRPAAPTPIAEVEPNDTVAQAQPVGIGDTITGTISTTTDVDVFGFPVTAGGKVVIQVDGDPERDGVQFDPNFDILNSAGAVLDSVDSSSVFGGGLVSESAVYTTTVFSTTANYYVRVQSDSTPAGGSTTGTYNLHIFVSPKVPCQPSPTPTNTSTPSITPTGTPTPTPTGGALQPHLVIHVNWQGIPQPNSRNTTETVTTTLRPAFGGPVYEFTGSSTDASGFFTLTVGSVPNSTYYIRVKGPRNLSNGFGTCTETVTLTGEWVIQHESGLMPAGDAVSTGVSNFNIVNATDFITLKNTFGRSYGQFGYDSRADFDNNDVVNAADFTLLAANFGQAGCGPGLKPGDVSKPGGGGP